MGPGPGCDGLPGAAVLSVRSELLDGQRIFLLALEHIFYVAACSAGRGRLIRRLGAGGRLLEDECQNVLFMSGSRPYGLELGWSRGVSSSRGARDATASARSPK